MFSAASRAAAPPAADPGLLDRLAAA